MAIELKVTAAAHDGRGVARLDGVVYFVTGALPGETVSAEVTRRAARYSEARTVALLTPSPDRIEQSCPQFGVCGGCVWRTLDYARELEYKRERVEAAFKRLGGLEVPVAPVIPSLKISGYRNKVTLPFAGENGAAYLGVYAANSHKVIKREGCDIYDKRLEPVIAAIESWASRCGARIYDEKTGHGFLAQAAIRVGSSGEMSLMLTTGDGALPHAGQFTERLASLGVVSFAHARISEGGRARLVWGGAGVHEELAGVKLSVSPASFMQVNHDAAELLYKTALDMADIKPGVCAADLCCGVGSITLAAAKRGGRMLGAEISATAVDDAKENARQNGLEAEFFRGDAGEALAAWSGRGLAFDALIADPPRSGLTQAALEGILKTGARCMVYVSCDPATLARDCALLAAGGLRPIKAQPVDMFPRTPHVETAVLLSRANS